MNTDTNSEKNASNIRSVLRKLIASAEGMEAAAVISRDGLSTAAELGEHVDADQLSAMCAALLSLADTTANELECGNLKQVLLDGDKGLLLLVHIGKTHVLALSAGIGTNIGLCLMEAKKSAQVLQGLLI